MTTVVVSEGGLHDLLDRAITGSVISLGEIPHTSWGVDQRGEIYITQQGIEGLFGFDWDGALVPMSDFQISPGVEYVKSGRQCMRRGNRFFFVEGGDIVTLGLHDCDAWKVCSHGIAFLKGIALSILVIKPKRGQSADSTFLDIAGLRAYSLQQA